MALFDINAVFQLSPEFFTAVDRIVAAINRNGGIIMNDLTKLETAINNLEAKITETNATLAGLAQAVIDLKASGDVQAGIDALAAKAEAALASLSAAEDAADDQLPTP